VSVRHPVIAVTGSSGAGTTSVMHTFTQIFRREQLRVAFVEGDSFHRFDRAEMKARLARTLADGDHTFSHFGPEANLFEELEKLFRRYGENGGGSIRNYVHDDEEAARHDQAPGTFTPWRELPPGTDLLFYEGLHAAVATSEVDIARLVDLLIGVVPVINLEWIQKIHRDRSMRGYSTEAVTDTILRRMPDYVRHICPQFSRTDVNFQRVPMVDTSNPFIARAIPTLDESMLIIRFRQPHGIDFPYLLSMLHDSFMSRPNTIVCPGGKMDLAMQLILTPMIWRLIERRDRERG
jgi:phosphoribulokinase